MHFVVVKQTLVVPCKRTYQCSALSQCLPSLILCNLQLEVTAGCHLLGISTRTFTLLTYLADLPVHKEYTMYLFWLDGYIHVLLRVNRE